MTGRYPPLSRFTTMEKLVMALVARGHTYREVGLRLSIGATTARWYAQQAAAKMPGDLPCKMRIIFWARGATPDQLTGEGWTPGTARQRSL